MKPHSQRNRLPVGSTSFEDAYPLVRRVAGVRAAAVAKVYGLSHDQRSDLEQEAIFQVWRKLAAFDPSRSSLKTFIERLVANKIASSIRRQQALKRHPQQVEYPRVCFACEADRLHLRIDVSRVLDRLRPNERDICRMLVNHSASDVSRRAKISRAALYRKIAYLRVIFIEAGLQQSFGQGRKMLSNPAPSTILETSSDLTNGDYVNLARRWIDRPLADAARIRRVDSTGPNGDQVIRDFRA